MADLDSGHLFLTWLIPIKNGAPTDAHAPSYEQSLRIELAKLPPAHQTPVTQKLPFNSPFARNRRNHFARMFVLDDVIYNGRNGQDAIVSTIQGENTIYPKPIDQLNCAYLVFTVDIDAIEKDGDPLPKSLSDTGQKRVRLAYAQLLWDTMEEEIRAIFSNCFGFEKVQSGADFGAYLDRCHVETTMPFHDYYLSLPEFHTLPAKPLIWLVAVPGVVGLVGLLVRILGMESLFGINTLLLAFLGLALAAVAFVWAVKYAISNGSKPLAPAKYDDLPSVLKALYTQQRFADFAVKAQGMEPQALHAAFGEFLAATAPHDVTAPTQAAGVISADASRKD